MHSAGDAEPGADGGQRSKQNEAADVTEQVAQIRHLRSAADPLRHNQYTAVLLR